MHAANFQENQDFCICGEESTNSYPIYLYWLHLLIPVYTMVQTSLRPNKPAHVLADERNDRTELT